MTQIQELGREEKQIRWLNATEYLLLVLTLTLAGYLRLTRVAVNPGWYSDEGTHLAIARALVQGENAYLAIKESTLLFAKLPLFEGLLAFSLRLGGDGMTTLRTLTGLLGTATVLLLYLVTRRRSDDRVLALLAALLLAIYPQAVLYSRFGFSYNLLAPLWLLVLLALSHYEPGRRPRGLFVAGGIIGLGLLSDLMMGAMLPLLILAGWRRPRDLTGALGFASLPFLLYTAAMFRNAPDAFCFDLVYTVTRLGGTPLGEQLVTLGRNYTILLTQDSWWALGIAGLFLLRPAAWQKLVLGALLLALLLLGRTEALYGLSAYYVTALLPLVALGVAALLRYGTPAAARSLGSGGSTRAGLAAVTVLVAVPILVLATSLSSQVQGRIPTAIDSFLVSPTGARAAADYVNARLKNGELVVASPAVAWQIEGNAADFQMAAAAAGNDTPHMPADLPPERWAFDARWQRARFVIVDPLWHNWAAWHVPGVAGWLSEVTDWHLRLQVENVLVYERQE